MKKLDKILAIYIDDENKAAQKCFECQEHYDRQLQLLEELQQYETDYKKQFLSTASDGVSVAKIKNYQIFIDKLRSLILRQRENVKAEKRNLDIATEVWQEKRLQRRTLDKLEERLRLKERHAHAKNEQKQFDEQAQRQFRRNGLHD